MLLKIASLLVLSCFLLETYQSRYMDSTHELLKARLGGIKLAKKFTLAITTIVFLMLMTDLLLITAGSTSPIAFPSPFFTIIRLYTNSTPFQCSCLLRNGNTYIYTTNTALRTITIEMKSCVVEREESSLFQEETDKADYSMQSARFTP